MWYADNNKVRYEPSLFYTFNYRSIVSQIVIKRKIFFLKFKLLLDFLLGAILFFIYISSPRKSTKNKYLAIVETHDIYRKDLFKTEQNYIFHQYRYFLASIICVNE